MSPRGTKAALIVALALLLGPRSARAKEVVRAKDSDATDVTESGIHAGLTQVRGGDKNAQLGAFGLWNTHVGFGYERPATIRVINSVSLAGGAKGIEGGFGNAVAGGARVNLGKNHGLLARGGFEASFFGNKYLWDSLLELPQLHLGYQWLVPGSVADVALKGGYVLLGAHNTGDGSARDLGGSLEWGAIGSLHLGPVDLNATYSRIYPRHEGTPVDLVESAFCGNASRVSLCTNFRYEYGDVRVPGGRMQNARVSYVGLTLSVVLFEKKPKKQ